MKQSIKKYVICDPTTNLFWEGNVFHGHGPRGSVFEVKFTSKLTKAALRSKKEAKGVLSRFDEFDFISTQGVDIKGLTIIPITISYEV